MRVVVVGRYIIANIDILLLVTFISIIIGLVLSTVATNFPNS
ncbi:MAG: hypothetical protein ACFFB9_16580 [Promethearchaeota archaeon]